MYEHQYKKRVRYGETDQMGYLYYGNYPMYYEIGRTEMIRDLVMPYAELEKKHGLMMPVMFLESKYLLPAKYDDHLTIVTKIKEMPGKLISFHHEILNEEEKIINKGLTKLFFVDMKSNRRVSTPEFITNPLKAFF